MFKQLFEEIEDYEYENFTYEDILESLDLLTQEEINEVGEFITDLIYEQDFDEPDEQEEQEEIQEVKKFTTRKAQLQRAKKKNPAQVRKDKKARKIFYKKNKKYRKKVKRQPNKVRHHF